MNIFLCLQFELSIEEIDKKMSILMFSQQLYKSCFFFFLFIIEKLIYFSY